MGWVLAHDYITTQAERDANSFLAHEAYNDQQFGHTLSLSGTILTVKMRCYENKSTKTFYTKTFTINPSFPIRVTTRMMAKDFGTIRSTAVTYYTTDELYIFYANPVGWLGDSLSDSYLPYRITISVYEPTPATTPSTITVPSVIKGGTTINISWGISSYATTYYLERSVNGGAYTQIYSDASRSYSDTIIKGWISVAYRVRASSSDGSSGYRTSSTIAVQNFPELKIRIDSTLKTSDNGWCKIVGQLREVDRIWTRINGVLKEV